MRSRFLTTVKLVAISFLACIFVLNIQSQAIAIDRNPCEADGQFTFIPAGEFQFGSTQSERDYGYRISAAFRASQTRSLEQIEGRLRQQGWFDREPSPQRIFLPDFCLQTYPVTNAEYQQFIRATNYPQPGITAAEYQEQGFLVHPYEDVIPYLWQQNRYPQGEGQHPVVLVSYEDARAFARWKGERDGFSYRLPTAAEWEKAARGIDGRYFPWGNQWRGDATNWGGNDPYHTSPIGAFAASTSPYGVGEMAGNIFEYTSTLEARNTRQVSVMKGCSWDDSPGFCRAAYRHTRPVKSRHILFGFRLVREHRQ